MYGSTEMKDEKPDGVVWNKSEPVSKETWNMFHGHSDSVPSSESEGTEDKVGTDNVRSHMMSYCFSRALIISVVVAVTCAFNKIKGAFNESKEAPS